MRSNDFRTRVIYVYFVLWAALFSQNICRAQGWISVGNSQIEVLTDNHETDAQAALRVFEGARQFFLSGVAFPVTLQRPVRIFAFRSKDEYSLYRLNSNAFGHFLHTSKSDYIVLQDIEPDHYEAALHEYTHYVVKQAGLNLPVWLNEGLADLYSSIEPNQQVTLIGRPLSARTSVLAGAFFLNLETLFSITAESSYYNQGGKLPFFYAESWALTHMLALDQRYASRFPDFLKTVSSGVPSGEALLQVYGRTMAQVKDDLQQYGPRLKANQTALPVRLNAVFPPFETQKLSEAQIKLALTDLLAAHPATAPEAMRTLRELAQKDPGNPLWEERLGQAAWTMSRTEEARTYFARAVEHGSQDADAVYRYALMQKQAGAPNGELMQLFERVLHLSPDHEEARLRLGLLQFNEKQFNAASQSLSKLKVIKEEWSFAYYSVMAYCSLELHRIEAGKLLGQKAKDSAKTLDEQSQADQILSYYQQMEISHKRFRA